MCFQGGATWKVKEGPLILSLSWAAPAVLRGLSEVKPGSPESQLQYLPPWPPCQHTHQWLCYLQATPKPPTEVSVGTALSTHFCSL